MIKLTKIERNNDIINCTAFVEDSKTPLALQYSISKNEFLPFQYPEGYEWCTAHIAHAKRYLMNNIEKLPKEEVIMWY